MPLATLVVAKVIVVSPRGELLVLRRSASDVRRPGEWDLPGGHSDGDEFAEEAATRETLEEAGIQIDPRKLQLLTTRTEMVEADKNVHWLFYAAKTDQTEVKLSSEHDEYRWVSLDEACDLISYDRQNHVLEYVRTNSLLA